MCSFFVLTVAQDVEPPILIIPPSTNSTSTEAPVLSTTVLDLDEPGIQFNCPLNCTCTDVKKNIMANRQFYPISSNSWNTFHMGRMRQKRYYQHHMQQYADGKFRTCNKGYSFCRGVCVKRHGNIFISCEFPQKELPCCHIEFPKKCHKSIWGEKCYVNTYYYCGELCDKKDNLSEKDLNNLVGDQMREKHWQNNGKSMRGSV